MEMELFVVFNDINTDLNDLKYILFASMLQLICFFKSVNFSPSLMGPATRLMMQHYGIKEADVSPTGPKGNILKS